MSESTKTILPCRNCGATDRRQPRGNQNYGPCRPCENGRNAAWKKANPGRGLGNPVTKRATSRAWKRANPDRVRAAARTLHAMNPNKRRAKWLRDAYGITLADYERMHAEQKGCCAVCSGEASAGRPLHVDHDHSTGKVRQLLCSNCNVAVGLLKDSYTRAIAVAEYLKRHQVS